MDESDFLDEMAGAPAPVIDAPEPEAGPVRDDQGRFAPKETGVEPQPEPVAGEVSPTPDKLPKEEYEAVKGERKRRQEAEARLAALEQQLQQLQPPPAAPPTIWEDETAALQHNRQQAVQEASFHARLDTSEMLAAQAFDDFEEMRAKFLEMMAISPALQQQALAARHPWGEAYKIAKNAARAEALGATDVGEIEARLRAQIEAEYAAKAPQTTALPRSLADAPSGVSGAPMPSTDLMRELFG